MVSRSYAAPVQNYEGLQLDEMSQDLAEKIMLGVTTYLWECLLTGDVKTKEILGSDSDVLSELLNKVRQYGTQVVKDEKGVAFAISLVAVPTPVPVDASTLPMRKI